MKKILSLITLLMVTAGLPAAMPQAAPNIPSDSDFSEEDANLAKNIRQALIIDRSLSKYAQSIRVTANNGNVTLQGYVASEKEKQSVLTSIKQIHGVTSIDDQLSIVSR